MVGVTIDKTRIQGYHCNNLIQILNTPMGATIENNQNKLSLTLLSL